jgi:hypothetical protein
MEGSTVRGMGVTLPIIIEGLSVTELLGGGIQFSTPLCVSYSFNVPIVSDTVTAGIKKCVSSK